MLANKNFFHTCICAKLSKIKRKVSPDMSYYNFISRIKNNILEDKFSCWEAICFKILKSVEGEKKYN